MTASVYGVRETLKELRELDKRAQLACQREMKHAAQPLANAIARYLPHTPPLSGFDHLGRTGWNRAECWAVGIRYGGRKSKKRDEWPLLSLRLDAAPTVLFDMAGRKSSNRLSSALSRSFGGASRAAWRPERELFDKTAKAVLEAVEQAMKETNEQLVYKPGKAL